MRTKINVPIEDQTLTRKAILLVEDDHDDAELALHALRKGNILNEVVVAHDGEEALARLFGNGADGSRDLDLMPAVVLLDLKLPKISGLDVLRQIRRDPWTQHLPVVVLTNSNEEQDSMAAHNSGASSFLRKPIDFEKFAEAVDHLGMSWVLSGEHLSPKEEPAALAARSPDHFSFPPAHFGG